VKARSSTAVADASKPAGSVEGARQWLAKAHDDLTVAEVVFENATGVNWAACFHAQQASEKAIKALLVACGIDFPRSHSVDRLLALLPSEMADEFDLDALEELTPWAVAGRYPEDIANPDLNTTRRLIESATSALACAARLAASLTESKPAPGGTG
jgi:HEPN domain-containing protein